MKSKNDIKKDLHLLKDRLRLADRSLLETVLTQFYLPEIPLSKLKRIVDSHSENLSEDTSILVKTVQGREKLISLAQEEFLSAMTFRELWGLIIRFAQEKEGILEDILGFLGVRY
ncbi:MAG: hypothetical protein ACE5HR_00230 [bacterium]